VFWLGLGEQEQEQAGMARLFASWWIGAVPLFVFNIGD